MKPIVVVGSINFDLVCRTQRIPSPGETVGGSAFQTFHGGKGANQAVAISRLGASVAMIGKVGNDDFGRQLRHALVAERIETGGVTVVAEASSGVALIVTDARGQNSIVVVPGANGELTPADIDKRRDLLGSAGMVLCQLEVPMETVEYVAELAEKSAVPLMLDPAPAQPLSGKLLARVCWLTPNETEAATLCGIPVKDLAMETAGEVAAELRARGAKCVVVKMGALGAYFAAPGNSFYQPAYNVRCVDSTAAGDAFNGALAVSLCRGDDLSQAARFACAAAALSTTRPGAQPSMPTEMHVEEFLNAQ